MDPHSDLLPSSFDYYFLERLSPSKAHYNIIMLAWCMSELFALHPQGVTTAVPKRYHVLLIREKPI